ncbi:peptidoglycan-binding protein [Halomonas faecis]|uniref:peptidoglycan-binding protein n=1 Tax=Halomonas faecis TaxID=1562110 RepID=UPI0013D01156|nr:peptidoglycan-binding protein [Halomonas faecis]
MHRYRNALFSLGLILTSTAAIGDNDEFRPHPACFEPFVPSTNNTDHPASLNLDACSDRHAHRTVSQFLSLTRYERSRGEAGVSRGSLAYERITGRDDSVMYRLVDNVGGSGIFTMLVTGRETDTASGRVLQDIETHGLGDRCHLGSAWVGQDEDNDIVVGVALTPANVPHLLAAPGFDMPNPERDRYRVRHAFGGHFETAQTACPTCCIGEATYALAKDGNCWDLLDIRLDSLQPFEDSGTDTLASLLHETARETPEGYVIKAESVASIQRDLIAAHPNPTDTARAQFWLKRLGFYWLASVDGVAGPQTEAAIAAWREWRGEPMVYGSPMLTPEEANALAREGLRYDGTRLQPMDEAWRDPTFAAFRDRLRRVVLTRDSESLIAMTEPDIMLGFGGSGGHDDMREWLEHPESGEDVWRQLETILPLGAVRWGPDVYCLPYTGCLPTRLLAGHDPFTTVIVTATDAIMRSAPDGDATIVRPLDHDILTLIGDSSAHSKSYYPVRDSEGNEGFVSGQAIAFVIGPRMEIHRSESGWRIQSLVSGD